jgi:hypothetical protein
LCRGEGIVRVLVLGRAFGLNSFQRVDAIIFDHIRAAVVLAEILGKDEF